MIVSIQNQSQMEISEVALSQWMEYSAQQIILLNPKLTSELEKELLIIFLDEAPARELNRNFRQKDYSTDVLSFEAIEPDSLGELVICSQVVARQSKENNHSFFNEAAYLCLHGLLHLLGYDHETNDSDAEQMYFIQDTIFENISNFN